MCSKWSQRVCVWRRYGFQERGTAYYSAFFTAEGVLRNEIHARICTVYDENSMSQMRVLQWTKRYWEGCVSLKKQQSARAGSSCHYPFCQYCDGYYRQKCPTTVDLLPQSRHPSIWFGWRGAILGLIIVPYENFFHEVTGRLFV